MDQTKEEDLECAVCLQPCVHPVKLPCSHIFCFLCVKGVANQSKRCAMCRQEIPADYLDNPTLLKKIDEKESEIEGYQWFYEGRNGWWKYDRQTNEDVETAFNNSVSEINLMICGQMYTLDLVNLIQLHKKEPWRKRKIKRDISSSVAIGIAGLTLKTLTSKSATPKRVPNATRGRNPNKGFKRKRQ